MHLVDQYKKHMPNPKEITGIFPTENGTKYLKTIMLLFAIIQPSILGAGVWEHAEALMSSEPMSQLQLELVNWWDTSSPFSGSLPLI